MLQRLQGPQPTLRQVPAPAPQAQVSLLLVEANNSLPIAMKVHEPKHLISGIM